MSNEIERLAQFRVKSPSRLVQIAVSLGRRCRHWLQSVSDCAVSPQFVGVTVSCPGANGDLPTSLSKLGDSVGGNSEQASGLSGRETAMPDRLKESGFAVLDDFPIGKRVADIVLIVLATPLWLPVMGAIACWILLVSDGPVFFRQKRVGYGERRFPILKFRSMEAGADTEVHEKHVLELMREGKPMTKLDLQGDSRLIPGGFIMRALGLDELPQLFNVLAGEMSLIGPRPCTPGELSQYSGPQRERFLARPGLTGYWQVNGKNRTTFAEMVALDIDYRRHRSAILDLAILIQTGPALFMQLAEAKAGLTARAVDNSESSSESCGSKARDGSKYQVEQAIIEVGNN